MVCASGLEWGREPEERGDFENWQVRTKSRDTGKAYFSMLFFIRLHVPMSLIGFLLRASWKIVAIAAFAGFLSGACSALLIALINYTVSGAADGAYSTVQLLQTFVGLTIASLLSSFLSRVLLVSLSQTAIYRLRLRLSQWILACPLRHLEELGANRLLATLTDDVQSISNVVFAIPFLCIDLTLILGCLVYLGWLSWTVLLVTVLFLVLAIAAIQVLLNRSARLLTLAREEQDRLFKHFRAITDGIKELKLHRDRRDSFVTQELEVSAQSSRNYRVKSLTILAIASSLGELLFFAILGLLVFGLPLVTAMTPAVLSGYVLTLTYVIRPIQNILEVLPGLSQAGIALRKIDRLGLALASRSEILTASEQRPAEFKSIQLCQVTHTYAKEEDSFTLGAIDLVLHPGELVFIVGGNGSGKSTLAKLITGLYRPEAGEIYLDGNAVTDENQEDYRQLFATVFSDFFLFEKLMGIRLQDLDAEAFKYLQQLHLDQKVTVNSGVLSTIDLSQGQRKRLALLTAYLEDRPVYLFDEWAADQDPFFREVFYQQILPDLRQRGKLVLVISHDDRYFQMGDRIIKLDYGKLV
jgi:putative pyoverdin transport system ATP-binding/permease protein